ncbi:MAG: hypothetical protein F4Z66_08600, partial [Gammaproteobacteria bacterium]|nr:hypothetical protein [Gammaproteobacteria bacterium]
MAVRLDQLFEIKSGDYHAVSELGSGDIPVVSCGDINHGYVGRFDVPRDKRYSDALTVAYNGPVLTVKFRPYVFGAKDDIGILIPKSKMDSVDLVYVATIINSMRWRFSYGRKCFREKLQLLVLNLPVKKQDDLTILDKDYIDELIGNRRIDMRPRVTARKLKDKLCANWKTVRLNDIFDLKRGDFHSISALGLGNNTTVSRTEKENGVVGRFERPDAAQLYPPGRITVSTVTGDAFVQVNEFMATDNVVILVPRSAQVLTTSYFIASLIN